MLRELSIENLAVIEKASIAFDDKLNVFTGETGAGKSILIGGINAILGGRVSKDIVRAGTEKAVVTGLFDDLPESVKAKLSDNGFAVDDELLLQRDIHADGKSTARINGRATTVAILRDIASELIDIHGQHDNRLLMDGDNQREILDSYGKNSGLLSEYATAFKEFSALSRKIKEVSRKKTESLEKAELLRERLEELDRYNFSADEEETVKQKIEELRNAEYISENLYNAQTAISGDDDTDGAYSMLEHCKNSVSSLSNTIPELDKLAERISDMLVELEDIREEIVQRIPDEDEDTAGMLGVLEERLSVILRLQRKYGTDLAQILENSEKWRNELYEIDNGDDIIEELTEKKKEGLNATVFSFDKAPGSILSDNNDDVNKRAILTSEERENILSEVGIDTLFEYQVNLKNLSMPAEKFVTDIIRDALKAEYIAVGEDFHFGYKRQGNVRLLKQMADECGFEIEVVKKEQSDGKIISSSRIRECLKNGNIEKANALLGYAYSAGGVIVKGNQLGRTWTVE
mgnify:CR=1 FL=1